MDANRAEFGWSHHFAKYQSAFIIFFSSDNILIRYAKCVERDVIQSKQTVSGF